MHDLVKISDTINLPRRNRYESPELQHGSPSGTPGNKDFGMDVVETTDVHHNSPSSTLTDATQTYTETFPSSGRTYGTGKTFMDIFGAD